MFASNGVLGAGGFNQRIYSNLTLMHEVAKKQGIAIVVTLNPVDEDPVKMESVFKNLSSSVDVVWVQSTRQAGNTLKISGIQRIRKNRSHHQFGESPVNIIYDIKAQDGEPRIVVNDGVQAPVIEIATDYSRSTLRPQVQRNFSEVGSYSAESAHQFLTKETRLTKL